MRRPVRFQEKWMAAAAAAVLVAAAVAGVWAMSHARRGPVLEPASQRVLRQIREQAGPRAELRYSEVGQRRGVCGYLGRSRGAVDAVGFVSIPNRILFSDDPLPAEFKEMRQQYCPGFLTTPPTR